MNQNNYIDKTAKIDPKAQIGNHVKIWNWTKVRENVIIGNNVTIGQCVYIDKNVKIGSNVKIQNGVSVYDGVIIESDVFIGPNVTFTNDKYPKANNKDWVISPTIIKKGASIGANSTIICGCTIGESAMIGAGSVVTKNIPDKSLVYGSYATVKND